VTDANRVLEQLTLGKARRSPLPAAPKPTPKTSSVTAPKVGVDYHV
jgi:hypothetical protein